MPNCLECVKEKVALLTSCFLSCTPLGSRNCRQRAVEKGRNEGDVCVMAHSPNPEGTCEQTRQAPLQKLSQAVDSIDTQLSLA